ncbi:MAG: sodium:solute symporter [Planctomycetota bacterium]
MNMHVVDWMILFGLAAFMVTMALVSRRHMKSVADFLAANRCAGKYLIAIAEGAAMTGAIAFIATFEMYYQAGFTAIWWGMIFMPVGMIIGISGWIIYRFRMTRAMTLAQFFEMRYSKKFRIFAGMLGFLSGILNFGIFPSVGSRFFIYFCGLPQAFEIVGLNIPTYPVVMGVLLSVALFFTFSGGQITVIITDFFQGIFCYIAFLVILVVLFRLFSWSQITEALMTAPEDASMLNPFRTNKIPDFNIWYFLIGAFGMFFTHMAWQGTQGYNCAAATPHEARMGKVLACWKSMSQWLILLMPAVCAFVLMKHPDFAGHAEAAGKLVAKIGNPQIQNQMTVPIALSTILPKGVMGIMCAVMFAAFVSVHDTYLHTWGSIFIQDVVMPFRKKPFSQKEHIMLLRAAIIGVAVYAFFFSLFFRQTQHILLFFAITGTIYLGGAGAVIIGGLYWKHGTGPAAFVSMITGSVLGVGGIILDQLWVGRYGHNFPVNGQWMFFIAMVSSMSLYVLVSLLGPKSASNMDKLLHRGKYAVQSDTKPKSKVAGVLLERLGIGKEFSRADKIICLATVVWNIGWFLVLITGAIWNWVNKIDTLAWADFWRFFIWFNFAVTILVTIWLSIGGLIDVKRLFSRLATMKRDAADDGTVKHEDYIPQEQEPDTTFQEEIVK